jgi:hypothetical protein
LKLFGIERRRAMTKISSRTTMIVVVLLAVLGGTVACAQDKYSLKSPDGIEDEAFDRDGARH